MATTSILWALAHNSTRRVELFDGLTRDELKAAFGLIEQARNWRDPISSVIRPDEFDRCTKACMFYTGTELRRGDDAEAPRGFISVTAAGYREGPCGP